MSTDSDLERIAAADAYVEALITHDGDSVPFAPGCTRIEQGIKTGFSGAHLRRSLNRGLQYRVIAAADARNYIVRGDEVRASYTVVTRMAVAGLQVIADVDEVFLIPDGRIHHIRVRFRPALRRIPR